MAIPQEVLDYIHNRVELKIHKIQITLRLPVRELSAYSHRLGLIRDLDIGGTIHVGSVNKTNA